MVEPREEGAVLEGFPHVRVGGLLEFEGDADADGSLGVIGCPGTGALIGGLHEAGPAARDHFATHGGEAGGKPPDVLVLLASRNDAGGAEDTDTVRGRSLRPEAGDVIHHIPQPEGRRVEYAKDFLIDLIAQGHHIGADGIGRRIRPGVWLDHDSVSPISNVRRAVSAPSFSVRVAPSTA